LVADTGGSLLDATLADLAAALVQIISKFRTR